MIVVLLPGVEDPAFDRESVDSLSVFPVELLGGSVRARVRSVVPPRVSGAKRRSEGSQFGEQLDVYLNESREDSVRCLAVRSVLSAKQMYQTTLDHFLRRTSSRAANEIPVKRVPTGPMLSVKNSLVVVEWSPKKRRPLKIAAARREFASWKPAALLMACLDFSAGYYDTFDAVAYSFFESAEAVSEK